MGVEGATSPLNDPGLVLLGAIVSEKKILKEKSRLLLVRSGRKKCGRRGRDVSFLMIKVRFSCYSFGEKILLKNNFFFPLFPVNRYNSAPVGPICTRRRALSNDPSSVLLGAIVSEKKIVKEKCFFPLFPLNSYNSAPIGPIYTQKIWAARRSLSTDPGPVLVGAKVSEKKIFKEKCFFPLFSLNCYSSAPICPIWTKKMWA
ncbi:LOW QUALITY PROTEIN: hypothetical protein V1477_006351 [Vespula maculifrons]|uniref:Uncharacterized protein n=1 Tax=Vespula maculifrons TaxID=7453 RepID=A0ABD2CK69_VESMC